MAVLFATFPLFVALFAHRFLEGDRLSTFKLLGIGLGFGGTAVLFWEGHFRTGEHFLLGMAVGLISPLAAAASNIVAKRALKDTGTMTMTTLPMAYGAVLLLPLGAGLGEWREMAWTPLGVGALIYLAVLGSALTFGLYYRLMEEVPVSRLAMIAYVTPVTALFLGWLILDETLTLRILLGTLLILTGIKVAGKGPAKKDKS